MNDPSISSSDYFVFGQPPLSQPILSDENLTAVSVVTGLGFPTKMAFLGPDDFLILEKNTMQIKRVTNGTVSATAQLVDKIWNETVGGERGLLGVAASKNNSHIDLFLYFTEEARSPDTGRATVSNRLYKYELHNDSLINPKLLLSVPNPIDRVHNGGALLEGPDGLLYLTVGDMGHRNTLAQNFQDGKPLDGTGAIHRFTKNGEPSGAFGTSSGSVMDSYFAYGLRNSFGISFDPVTGQLWDIESGPAFGDEVNHVEPGFNSGWRKVQGLWNPVNMANITSPEGLVSLKGIGNYSSPELTWIQGSCLSALTFLASDKYGSEYENDLFVANIIEGKLYNFDLNENRSSLVLNGSLSDQIVDGEEELDEEGRVFAEGLGGITDVQVGPDGYLYVLAGSPSETIYQPYEEGYIHNYKGGVLYKIVPANTNL